MSSALYARLAVERNASLATLFCSTARASTSQLRPHRCAYLKCFTVNGRWQLGHSVMYLPAARQGGSVVPTICSSSCSAMLYSRQYLPTRVPSAAWMAGGRRLGSVRRRTDQNGFFFWKGHVRNAKLHSNMYSPLRGRSGCATASPHCAAEVEVPPRSSLCNSLCKARRGNCDRVEIPGVVVM